MWLVDEKGKILRRSNDCDRIYSGWYTFTDKLPNLSPNTLHTTKCLAEELEKMVHFKLYDWKGINRLRRVNALLTNYYIDNER